MATKSARELARYSSYDQMVWTDASGVRQQGRVTADNVQAAISARGEFVVYEAHTAVAYGYKGQIALNYLANIQRGWA